jgi:hypothetical protein
MGARVRELQLALQGLRQQVRRTTRSILFATTVLVGLLAGIGYGVTHLSGDVDQLSGQLGRFDEGVKQIEQGVQQLRIESQEMLHQIGENSFQLSENLKSHIRHKAEDQLRAARERSANWEEIREIERRRDAAFGHVEDLIETLQQGLAATPDDVFVEATRILNGEGADAAIGYLRSHQDDLLTRVDLLQAREVTYREQKQRALEPLLLQADLHVTDANWDESQTLYRVIVEKAPEWSRARRQLGRLLADLAQDTEAEIQLAAALQSAKDAKEIQVSVEDLGVFYLQSARWKEAEPLLRRGLLLAEETYGPDDSNVASCLNNLAQLFQDTNRQTIAEPLLRRALAISQRPEELEQHPNPTYLNNLAALLRETGRRSESGYLYQHALALTELSVGSDHPSVAILLNNLASTHNLYPPMKELLHRRALAIRESWYEPLHPETAISLTNLATVLAETKRIAPAEALYRRAIAIYENTCGLDHPDVAATLRNFSQLLQRAQRPKEALTLTRKSLAIDEKSYGADHPVVSQDLDVLASLLEAEGSPAAAEPISRRAVQILAQFNHSTGREHPRMEGVLADYIGILSSMNMPDEERSERIQVALSTNEPLSPILPLVENSLGPEGNIKDVWASLDEHHRETERPAIWFLPLSEPITPHLDEWIGPSKLDTPLTEPFAPYFNEVYGLPPSVTEVLERSISRYRKPKEPVVWLIPLNEPISPHLDELIGPPGD